MFRKLSGYVCTAILLFSVCMLSAFGAGGGSMRCVYVKTGSNGSGASAEDAVGTLTRAAELLKDSGGEIVLCGTVTLSGTITVPEVNGDLKITAASDAKVTLIGALGFEKNTNSNTITLDLPLTTASSAGKIFGGFNSIVFGKNFTASNGVDFYGGVSAALGEMGKAATNRTVNAACITELPYSITVENGSFRTFFGGNNRADNNALFGSLAAPLTVTINGGSFTKAFSLSGMSLLADDATLTINGGSFACPIYAQGCMGQQGAYSSYNSIVTMSDSKYYAVDGDITIIINGGSFSGGLISAEEEAVSFRPCLRGDFSLTIGSGASFSDGTVLDATQVKAYAGESHTATLTAPNAAAFTVKRFDMVNGKQQTYTEPLRMTFVGDSITQGTSSSNLLTKSYGAQVYALAVKDGKEVIIGNYGVGASVVMDANPTYYYANTLAYKLAYYEADGSYVLIALGTNDAPRAGGTHATTLYFAEMYEALVRSFGVLPDTERVYTTSAIYRLTSTQSNDVRAVSVIRPLQKQVTEQLAAEAPNKYFYVDMYALLLDAALNNKLLSRDNLHPNDSGYVIYGQAVYDAIFHDVRTKDIAMTDIYISDTGKLNAKGTKDDPLSSLSVALGRAAEEATIHVVGRFTFPGKIVTPLNLKKLTIVGEGSDATFSVDANTFKFLSDAKMDNITLSFTASTATLCANFNSLELTETFRSGSKLRLAVGRILYTQDTTKAAHDTVQSASSDKNITITVNGGSFTAFIGGNYRTASDAPIGTYSGNMRMTIGEGVQIDSSSTNGIVGQNYLTGTVNATVLCTNAIAKHASIGTLSGVSYSAAKNTGTININTEKPAETTAAPAETTAAPAETTAAPAETTAKPVETTAKPAETTATPKEPTETPEKTQAKTEETTPAPTSQQLAGTHIGVIAAVALIAAVAIGAAALLLHKKKK